MVAPKEVFDFYVSQGLAPHQAAALVGHMSAESRFDPTVQETLANGQKGPGYGLFQWTSPDRKAGLYDFAKSGTGAQLDPNDWKTQALYSLRELDTTEKRAGDKLYAAQTYDDAIKAGMDYLRPQGYTPNDPTAGHNYAGRYNAGAEFVGQQPMMGPAIAAAGSVEPQGGLLQPTGIDAEIADWKGYGTPEGRVALDKVVAEKAMRDRALSEASDAALSAGRSLLAPVAPQQEAPLQAQMHRPQAAGVAMPNFSQMLAQQRLMRRM